MTRRLISAERPLYSAYCIGHICHYVLVTPEYNTQIVLMLLDDKCILVPVAKEPKFFLREEL